MFKKCFPLILISILLASFFLAGHAHALDVPKLQGRVNDYANMMSPSTKAELEKELASLEQTDSTQIVILTIPSLEGEVIEEFSIKAAEAWKIGQKGKDNGIIIIVAKQEKKIRIEVGRGLEGKLTDLAAGRIMDLVIKPKFKRGDFDGGFVAGVHSLIDATKGEFKADRNHLPQKSVFPAPPNLSATVNFSEPSGNKILDAEETGKLIITIKNTGKGDAFDVKAAIKSNKYLNGLRFKESVSLGTIPQGQSVSKEIELEAAEDIPTSEIKFTINIKEANGFDADPIAIAFKTKAFEPPKLIIADIGMDDANGNSKVEPLENVELIARIQNIGHGDARNVVADIIHGKNVFIGGDGNTHFNLGNIHAGKYKDIKFIFYTNKQIKNGEKIPLEIKIGEARPRFKSAKALDIVMNAPQRKTTEVFVQGEEQPQGEIQVAGGLSIDVDMKIPDGKKAGEDDIAVVIGNKNYKNTAGIPDVEYADRDARIMKEYLIKTFGFKQGNIIYAEDATVGKFNEIFGSEKSSKGKLFNYVKKDISEVFIYYVGHGAPDLQSQEAYFVPVDANPQYIASNGYSLQTFYANLSKLPAKKITIVLDACFSGNSDRGMLFKNISPAMVKVKKEYSGPKNAMLITSAAVDQVSTWYPEKKHSLFTYYFLKGLQGEADANNDKAITIGEMKNYLQEHVPHMARRLNNVEQHPVVDGNEKEILVRINK